MNKDILEIKEITIDEFENKIYDKYITLFPKSEQRKWNKVKETYEKGIEKFYKIIVDDVIIGFFMLEKLNSHPYYLDYFAIYKEYQNKSYGTNSLKKLIDDVIKQDGLIGEIEKVITNDSITERRLKFYKNLGFTKLDHSYLLYGVSFDPIIYLNNVNKEKIDMIFFDYYTINMNKEQVDKNCSIIK